MGVLGGIFVSKSGLRILIRSPQVPFLMPPKTPILGVFGYFGGTKNGTWGARIKILRPLFNTNTPLKPPFKHFGNHFGPRKSDSWPFYLFSCLFVPRVAPKSDKFTKSKSWGPYLGNVWTIKVVLEFWFGHSKCHFFGLKDWHFWQKWPFLDQKNGTLSGQIKILRPLL